MLIYGVRDRIRWFDWMFGGLDWSNWFAVHLEWSTFLLTKKVEMFGELVFRTRSKPK